MRVVPSLAFEIAGGIPSPIYSELKHSLQPVLSHDISITAIGDKSRTHNPAKQDRGKKKPGELIFLFFSTPGSNNSQPDCERTFSPNIK